MAIANNEMEEKIRLEAEKTTLESSKKNDGMSTKKTAFIGNRRAVPDENARKNIHMILKGEGVAQLKNLKSDLSMDSNTEVFSTALTLLDLLVHEYSEGTQIFLKRRGEELTPFEIFEH